MLNKRLSSDYSGSFDVFFFIGASISYDQTARLVNERLSYMKDVAGYKAEQHLPIEDLAQEKKVLDQSISEAESFGLNSETVKPFIVTQMNVAKAIQYRYRADWLSSLKPTGSLRT